MPYRYRCRVCKTRSRLYLTRAGAKEHGRIHRDEHHGGDHPDGERIQHLPHRRPERGELVAVLIVVILLLVALVQRLV